MQIQPHLDQSLAYIKRVLPWTISLKLGLGALLGAVGGAGILSYLTEYATYSYAIHYGIRPPLEGVPYLKVAVGFGSFFLLLTGAVVLTLTVMALRAFVWVFSYAVAFGYVFLKNIVQKIRSWKFEFLMELKRSFAAYRKNLDLSANSSASSHEVFVRVCTMVLLAIAGVQSRLFGDDDSLKSDAASIAYSFGYFYLLMATLVVDRPKLAWWFAIGSTLTYFAICIGAMFMPTQYSSFLRLVGYGGGLPVAVSMRDDPTESQSKGENFYLMLRTNESFVVMNAQKNKFTEIPRDQVRSISHADGGLRSLPYQLPDVQK